MVGPEDPAQLGLALPATVGAPLETKLGLEDLTWLGEALI